MSDSFERFAQFVPNQTDRAFLAGMTGCGKSYAAFRLLQWIRNERTGQITPRKYVIAHDAKGMLRWPNAKRVTTLRDLVKHANDPDKFPWIVYAPNHSELNDPEVHNAFFRLIYERGHTTAYVDEVRAICRGAWRSGYPEYYDAILTRGREMHVPLFQSTQEPTNIPSTLITQSDCIYAFRQKKESHAKIIAASMPLDPRKLLELKKQYFYFYRDGDEIAHGPERLGKDTPATGA